jgi:hypothetical protein
MYFTKMLATTHMEFSYEIYIFGYKIQAFVKLLLLTSRVG